MGSSWLREFTTLTNRKAAWLESDCEILDLWFLAWQTTKRVRKFYRLALKGKPHFRIRIMSYQCSGITGLLDGQALLYIIFRKCIVCYWIWVLSLHLTALSSGNTESGLKKARELMKVVKEWSGEVLPNKREVLGNLHSCIGSHILIISIAQEWEIWNSMLKVSLIFYVGNALMDLGNMDKALHHHEKDLELAKKG